MRQILLALTVMVTFSALGQRIIEGEIRLKSDSLPLGGVNVIEKGTDNEVNSDARGKFRITCKSADPTLEFFFLGLKTIEITSDSDQLTVYLEEDEEQARVKTRFGIYPEYTSVGFNSGVNYTPIGINIRNALPMLFGVKMLTTTDVTYRTNFGENDVVRIKVRKDQLIGFRYYSRYINLVLSYNRMNNSKDNYPVNAEDFAIVPELQFGRFLFLVGYGRQSFNDIETLKRNEGIIFGLGRYLNWNAAITAVAKKWSNYWQTEFQFIKGFERNDFEFGIRFETLKNYRELDLLLLYRIHY